MRNHPFPTHPAHSFCRAARGSWQIFEEAEELRSTDKLPRDVALSPSSRCSRHRRRGRHRPASRSASFSADLVLDTCSRRSMPTGASGTRARGESDGGGRGRACPMQAGHGGFACAACTDFFGLFLLACRLASARVLTCRMGMSSDRWTLTVTVYGRLSWRMCSTHHEGCLRVRARLGKDQGNNIIAP